MGGHQLRPIDMASIPYHNGAHRIMTIPSLYGDTPLIPADLGISTTLEVIPSKEFIPHSCLHRVDYLSWHDDYDRTPQLLRPGDNYEAYGGCIACITIISGERRTLHMVVRDPATFSFAGGHIPHKIYKVPLPIFQGINHIVWCLCMKLKVLTPTVLQEMLESEINNKFHTAANTRISPSIFFPELAPPTSTPYHKEADGTYKPTIYLKWGVPGAGAVSQYVYNPRFSLVMDSRHNLRNVNFAPERVEMLTDPKGAVSLWGQAWAAAGHARLRKELNIGTHMPPFLNPSYLHLRYKPRKLIGRDLYTYQAVPMPPNLAPKNRQN